MDYSEQYLNEVIKEACSNVLREHIETRLGNQILHELPSMARKIVDDCQCTVYYNSDQSEILLKFKFKTL